MSYSESLDLFFKILTIDFLRYIIPTGLAFLIFWVLLREKIRHRLIQKQFPVFDKLVFEFKYSLVTVLIFSLVGIGVYWLNKAELFEIYHDIKLLGLPYAIFSLFVAIVFHDFYFYWTHRFMHQPKIFKHVHLIHHKSTNPSPWAAYSFHPVEALIQALFLPILLLFLPMNDMIIFLFLAYMILRNVLGHLGFELFPKGFTRNKWLSWHTTSTHHNMHHKFFNCNYGLYFSWWDNIMKTTHDDYHNYYEKIVNRSKTYNKIKRGVFFAAILVSMHVSGQSPVGKWVTYNEKTGEELSVIDVSYDKARSIYEGKVDSIILQPYQGKDPLCTKCTGSKKNKKVIGMEVMSGFKSYGGEFRDGKILDPETGEIYNGKIIIKNDSTLIVRGSGGPLNIFSKTQKWIRVGEGRGIEGYWKTIDDRFNMAKSLIELKLDGLMLSGKIRELYLLPNEGNFPVCVSCKGKLKNKPIVGMVIMNNFRKSGEEWIDGEIMDPENGNTYKSKFWLSGNNQLIIRGYLGPFHRSQNWRRLDTFNKD